MLSFRKVFAMSLYVITQISFYRDLRGSKMLKFLEDAKNNFGKIDTTVLTFSSERH